MKATGWIIAIVVILALGIGAFFYFKKKTTKRAQALRIEKLGIGEAGFKKGMAAFAGYAVLSDGLPESIQPEIIKIKATMNGRLPLTINIKEPKQNQNKIDTLFFEFNTPLEEFIKESRRMQKTDSSTISGTLAFPVDMPGEIMDNGFTLDFDKKFKHFKYPIIKSTKLKVKKLGLKEVDVVLPVYMKNLEPVDLRLDDIYMRTTLGEDIEVESTQKTEIDLPAMGEEMEELPLTLKLKNPLKVIGKVITDNDEYITDIYVKTNFSYATSKGKRNTFPVVVSQKDTIELKSKRGENQEQKDRMKFLKKKTE